VTLELGGKSPAILDASCDMASAIKRLAFGKLLNAGQTCIAPDYLLVPAGQGDNVATQLAAAITRLYPALTSNSDYTAIISARHRQRLRRLWCRKHATKVHASSKSTLRWSASMRNRGKFPRPC